MRPTRTRIVALMIVTAGSAAALPVAGQTQPGQTTPVQRQPDQTRPIQAPPGDNQADRNREIARPVTGAKARSHGVVLVATDAAIGTDIISSREDQTLGEVEDLLINSRGGRVEYVVVARGGVLGVGETRYAVPQGAFDWNEERRLLVLPMTEEQLKTAPVLETGAYRTLGEDDRRNRLLEFYRVPNNRRNWDDDRREWMDDGRAAPPAADQPGMARDPARPAATSPDAKRITDPDRAGGRMSDRMMLGDETVLKQHPYLLVSGIKGQTLNSDQGSELGTVKDVIFDCRSGRVAFVAVSSGGVLGVNDTVRAVPWEMFRINNEGKLYAVKLDAERIKAAPAFEGADWKELSDAAFAPRVYGHYGQDGSWVQRWNAAAAARPAMATPTGTGRDDGAIAEPNRNDADRRAMNDRYKGYDDLYAKGEEFEGKGLVMLVENSAVMKDMPSMTSIALHTDDGRDVVVHLAPDTHLRQHKLALKSGDQVTVKGRWAEIDGKKCLMASSVTPANGTAVELRRENGERTWDWR